MAESKDRAADSAAITDQEFIAASPETTETPETPRAGLLRRIGFGRKAHDETEGPAFGRISDEPKPRPLADVVPRRVPLAAAVALALALGAVIGAGATLSLQRDAVWQTQTAASEPDRATELAAATQQLQDGVARLRAEVAALKTGIDSAQRSAGTQFTRLAEGLARVERQQASLAAAPTVTGSVPATAKPDPKPEPKAAAKPEAKPEAKDEARPQIAEGWRLLDYYAGRAVVETPAGRLYDVGAGSNLPGLGRVQSIKREGARIVLTARNGVVAGSIEPRRAQYYRHYR